MSDEELRLLLGDLRSRDRATRRDELYRAMIVVEVLGGASPEQTAVIAALGDRMRELSCEEPAEVSAESAEWARAFAVIHRAARGGGAG